MRLMLLGMLAIVAIVAGAAAQAVPARPACSERTVITAWLTSQYQEEPLFVGTVADSLVFEVWTAPSGTWSVLQTTPDGRTCIVAAGEDGEWLVQGRET